ncbi:MAG: cytochrome c3 family protein [Bacteroidota bacterium]
MKLRSSHILLFLLMGMLVSCSPITSYRILSFLFDGVPNFTKTRIYHPLDTLKPGNGVPALASFAAVPVAELVTHPPYGNHKCTCCHEEGLKSAVKPMPGVCYGCHDDFKDQYAFVHGPVGGGYCTACHSPHTAKLPKLLKRKGQQLCTQCHVLTEVMKNKAHSSIGSNDCTSCHNPHGGATRYALK